MFIDTIEGYLEPISKKDRLKLLDAVMHFSKVSHENKFFYQIAMENIPLFLNKMTSRELSVESCVEFIRMYLNYLVGDTGTIEWKNIKSLPDSEIVFKKDLDDTYDTIGEENIGKVAVLKVNGGLGTSMGCSGPKSLIEIKPGITFLDVVLKQMNAMRNHYNHHIPLVFMNSFYTDADTKSYLEGKEPYLSFIQNEFPRINDETYGPFYAPQDPYMEWAPPGHGDIYISMFSSGIVDELLSKGVEYIFVSNSDNLAATLDTQLLGYMIDKDIDFLMEVTKKTPSDIKGGILVEHNSKTTLLERAQVPDEHIKDFENVKKNKYFNTNNLWINLNALKEKREQNEVSLPIITNKKIINNNPIIQLESAMGAAIRYFDSSQIICVDRDRFLPIKTCDDLLLLKSDVYTLHDNGHLNITLDKLSHIPVIKLGPQFQKLSIFNRRFQRIPSLTDCHSLELVGDIIVLENVAFSGRVKIIVEPGQQLVLEDKVVDNLFIKQDALGNEYAVDFNFQF